MQLARLLIIISAKLGSVVLKKNVLWGLVTALFLGLIYVAIYARACASDPIWVGHSANKQWAVVVTDKGSEKGVYYGLLSHNASFKTRAMAVTTSFQMNDSKPFTTRNRYKPGHTVDFFNSDPGIAASKRPQLSVRLSYRGYSDTIRLKQLSFYMPWDVPAN